MPNGARANYCAPYNLNWRRNSQEAIVISSFIFIQLWTNRTNMYDTVWHKANKQKKRARARVIHFFCSFIVWIRYYTNHLTCTSDAGTHWASSRMFTFLIDFVGCVRFYKPFFTKPNSNNGLMLTTIVR